MTSLTFVDLERHPRSLENQVASPANASTAGAAKRSDFGVMTVCGALES
jgi:hypothetical protein